MLNESKIAFLHSHLNYFPENLGDIIVRSKESDSIKILKKLCADIKDDGMKI